MFDQIESMAPADLAGYTTDDLIELFADLERDRRGREVLMAALVGEIDRRGAFRDDGHRSIQAWCRSAGRWSPWEARGAKQVARLLRDHPQVQIAALNGQVPSAHLRELARAAANPRCGQTIGPFIPLLLREAERLEFVDFRAVVRHWERQADVDGTMADSDHRHQARRASLLDHDGYVALRADIESLHGAVMMQVFQEYYDLEFKADWAAARAEHGDATTLAHLHRTAPQRRADALVKIFVAASSATGTARTPLVNITLTYGEYLDELRRRHPETAPADDMLDDDPDDPDDPDHADGSEDLDEVVFEEDVSDGDVFAEDDDERSDGGTADAPFDLRRRGCEGPNGILLTPADAVDASLIGRVRRVVVDSKGVVLDFGRRTRLFRGAAREAVLLTSNRCNGSGCLVHSGRQADHLKPWGQHGITATCNGGVFCGHHNRLKNLGFRFEQDDAGYWHSYRPDGTEIGDVTKHPHTSPTATA